MGANPPRRDELTEPGPGGRTEASAPDAASRAAGRAARNTTFRATAEIISKLTSVAFFVVLARSFSTSEVGDWIFALAVVQLLWPISGFGLDRLITREVARDHAAVHRLFYPTVWLKVGANLAGVTVALAVLAFLDYSHQVEVLVLLFGLAQCLALVGTTALAVFQAHERMEYHFYASVPFGFFGSLIQIGVIALGGGLIAIAAIRIVTTALWVVVTFVLLTRRLVRPGLSFARRQLWRLYVESAPLGVQEVIGQIIFRIDAVLLSLLTTAAVVGAYGAGYRVLEATLFLAWSVGSAVLPMFSYLGRDSRPSLGRAYEASLKVAVALMAPVGVTLFVCSRPIVDLLFGLPKYDEAVPVLRWLAFAAVLYPIGYLSGELIALRRPGRFVVLFSAFVAAFNIGLNLVLIPAYEAAGAAAATLATEAALAVVGVLLARTVAGLPRMAWVLAAPVLAGLAMGAAMAPLAERLLIALPVGAFVYLAVLAILEGKALRGDMAAVLRAARRGAGADREYLQTGL